MRHFLPLLIVTYVGVGVRAGDDKGVVFTSEAGKFKVTMPAKPKTMTQQAPTVAGTLDVHLFIVDQKDRGFIASYTDYPKGSVTDANRQMTLDNVRDGNAKGVKGKLASEKKITLGKKKLEGREVLIVLPGGSTVYRARIFLAGDRLYQVVVIGPEMFAKSKAANAYLDSFQIDE